MPLAGARRSQPRLRRLARCYFEIQTVKDGMGILIVGGAEPLGKEAAHGCQFGTADYRSARAILDALNPEIARQ